jgi:DNA-binding transcriptional MerR regulator
LLSYTRPAQIDEDDPVGEIPQKLFYKVGEVCQYTDTQPYVLRFWESEFPGLAPEKSRNGQRVYRRQDIELILKIKKLLYDEEYTIAGVRKQLEEQAEAELEGGDGKKKKAAPPKRGVKQSAAAPAPEVSPARLPLDPPRAGQKEEPEEDFLDAVESAAVSNHSPQNEDLRRKLEETVSLLDRTREALHAEQQAHAESRRRSSDVASKLEALLVTVSDRAS